MTFKKGQSGNPSGRKKGPTKVSEYRSLLQSHADDLIAKAVEMALAGDATAMRLCIDRILPTLKAQEQPIPSMRLKGTLTEQGGQILKAATSGKLTPGEASSLLQSLASIARVTELDELIKRIEALEAQKK